jgi:hypothetical protein
MSTPYMSGFQGQRLVRSAMSAAVTDVAFTASFRATASRGTPRIRWIPNCRPLAWT